MKSVLGCLLSILFLFPISNIAADQQQGPQLILDEASFDFKEVFEGNKIEHTFKVYNKGYKPLEITKVESG